MDDPVVSIHNAIILFRNGKYLLLYKELKGFSIVAIIVTVTRHLLQILNYSYWSFMSFPGMLHSKHAWVKKGVLPYIK